MVTGIDLIPLAASSAQFPLPSYPSPCFIYSSDNPSSFTVNTDMCVWELKSLVRKNSTTNWQGNPIKRGKQTRTYRLICGPFPWCQFSQCSTVNSAFDGYSRKIYSGTESNRPDGRKRKDLGQRLIMESKNNHLCETYLRKSRDQHA